MRSAASRGTSASWPPAGSLWRAGRGFWWGLVCALGLALAPGADAAPRQPVASRASRPSELTVQGVRYVEARAFGARYGLKAVAGGTAQQLRFESQWTKLQLEAHQREITLNGLRLFLGQAVLPGHGSLYLTQTDADLLLGPILSPRSVERAVPKLQTIVLDPGHGGNDTGTRNAALKLDEKVAALDVAFRLKKLLEARGYRVLLTREKDVFVDLTERTLIANRAKADLVVCIHFNAVGGTASILASVKGTETYILTRPGQASTGTQRREPAAEKAVPGNRYDPWNAVAGYAVHRRLIDDMGTFDRGLKSARFKVITGLNCPSVYVEAAYLSNEPEARQVNTATYRQKIAASIDGGVAAYAEALALARKR